MMEKEYRVIERRLRNGNSEYYIECKAKGAPDWEWLKLRGGILTIDAAKLQLDRIIASEAIGEDEVIPPEYAEQKREELKKQNDTKAD